MALPELSCAWLTKSRQQNSVASLKYGFVEVFPPLVIGIWRQESEPLGLVQLLAFVKSIAPGIGTSPCCAFPFFTNCSKLRATCKSTPRDVKQGLRDADFLQRGTFEKGFLFNDS